jgi:hypothetical protein
VTFKIIESQVSILTLVFDPNNASEKKGIDEEMHNAEKLKKDAFAKRKGLVVNLGLSAVTNSLSEKDHFVTHLTTKLTYICHWSHSDDRKMPSTEDPNDPSNYLLIKLCPALSDSKKFVRLERLTILGCTSAFVSPSISDKLYFAKDSKKINQVSLPIYYCGLENNKINLYFKDKHKTEKLSEIDIHKNEISKINSKVKPKLKSGDLEITSLNMNSIKQQIPQTMFEIHKAVFQHSKNSQIAHTSNIYVQELLTGEDTLETEDQKKREQIQAYFSGELKEKKSVKVILPSLGNQFFTLPKIESDKSPALNLALAAERIINKERIPTIEIKGYTTTIEPKGSSIVPEGEGEIIGYSAKSIIYKR